MDGRFKIYTIILREKCSQLTNTPNSKNRSWALKSLKKKIKHFLQAFAYLDEKLKLSICTQTLNEKQRSADNIQRRCGILIFDNTSLASFSDDVRPSEHTSGNILIALLIT